MVESDGRVDSETNPTAAMENLETGEDKICGAEETRMSARTSDPMVEYA